MPRTTGAPVVVVAVVVSLPPTSLFELIWLYADTDDAQAIAGLSRRMFWLVFASLPLFAIQPALITLDWSFWPSLGIACLVTPVVTSGQFRHCVIGASRPEQVKNSSIARSANRKDRHDRKCSRRQCRRFALRP